MPTIRTARTYDVPELAELSGALGHPATRQQIVKRLAAIEAGPANCVLVADDAQGRVVGWVHVGLSAHLTDDACAEIPGLVVTEAARGAGIDADLLRAAEAWAQSHGYTQLRVRSRVERERAHRFYERAGYARDKIQLVFSKPLL